MEEWVKTHSHRTVTITTDDCFWPLACVLNDSNPTFVLIGFCSDSRRSEWQQAKVFTKRIKEMQTLT